MARCAATRAHARARSRVRDTVSILGRMTDIAALRKSYERAELDESASAADPLQQFQAWLDQAIAGQLPEPNAMTLATVGADGRPSTRVVLIKGFDERGIVWYTNYESRKGRELAAQSASPRCSSTGSSSSASCASKARSRRSARTSRTRTSRLAPARFAHRRLGLAAERGDRVAGDAGRQRGALRRQVHAQAAASAALGRLSPAARHLGVLAGPQVAPARPPALPARRRATGCASGSRPESLARATTHGVTKDLHGRGRRRGLLRHNRAAAFGRGPPDVNSFLATHGIESWKPVITALLLPPVPLLLLTLIGARLLLPRRGLGWLVILISVVLLWLSACTGAARARRQLLLPAPAALSFDRARELRAETTARSRSRSSSSAPAVEPFAPEYGVSSLQRRVARAAALWPLARRPDRRAGRLQRRHRVGPDRLDHARRRSPARSPPRSSAGRSGGSRASRATRARTRRRTIALLKPAGINHVVLVTHGYPHGARGARLQRSGPGARPDRGGTDGTGARPRVCRRSTGCRARPAFATCARCCASSPAALAGA